MTLQRPPGATVKTHIVNELTRNNEQEAKVGESGQATAGGIGFRTRRAIFVTIKDVSQGIFPGSILVTLQDADPDFLYLESDTKVFVEWQRRGGGLLAL